MNAVTPRTLRSDADDIERVWGEFADEDVMELAAEAAAALRKLATRISVYLPKNEISDRWYPR